VHQGEDDDQEQPRQFPEEFEHAPLPLVEVLDIHQVIVEHAVEAVESDAVDQHAEKEVPDAASGQKNIPVVEKRKVPHIEFRLLCKSFNLPLRAVDFKRISSFHSPIFVFLPTIK